MRRSIAFLLSGLLLSACGTSGSPPKESADWQPSTLSAETLEKVQAGLRVYQQCVNDETRVHIDDKMDSRRITDRVLQQCEDELSAIKPAFDAEQVPDSISERYLRSKRSRAAQQILRVVMATQAVRSTSDPR